MKDTVNINDLSLVQIGCVLNGVQIITNINLQLMSGNITVLFGLNGSGKTVLCDVICGILPMSEGKIVIDGRDISNLSPRIRFSQYFSRLFQKTNLFERLTIKDNMYLFHSKMRIKKPSKPFQLFSQNDLDVKSVLSKLGIDELFGELAGSLSIGQQRLANIAAVLIREKPFLIFDEPFSGLSPEASKRVVGLLVEEKKRGKGILVIEHRLEYVLPIADFGLMLHEGHIECSGIPSEIMHHEAVLNKYHWVEHETHSGS